ncbi:pilus assembly protein PilP [Vibrio alginolyticus]|uniref:pilus assembly protein PilP n=1 Tax=Vibrio sp. B1FLJ16 TaxID=2751178 RepID=UPI0015F6BFB4|nr:pilus assembly protein PilP [Vibrio sp. B1FLJ16]CAD7812425.1 assembly protein PilP [Vibrio sp. B1FLJ16]CAD7813752.1 assembly protein PilP [Vibrio sp. B1FLJ16]CAE6917509.1 assembly protein PilP [Vibrio sp. B1FLJ16]CAE6922206.1 assembly protein PilP [Vibrio sp. B1FLJ16]
MKNRSLLVVWVATLLVGCQANDESLTDFIRGVENQARRDVEKLKPADEYVAVAYDPKILRAPFELPREATIATQPIARKDCWQPPSRARSGKLEKFPLNQLRLKGVMGIGNTVSGLVQAPNGTVYKVAPGQYLGRNNGKVTQVTHSYLLINETLPDGLGCWQKRKVKLALR